MDKHKIENEEEEEDQEKLGKRKGKLRIVKDALIEVLAESKNGVSLAQLPMQLKKKLPFTLDLNELGFAKLKYLLETMDDEIMVELINYNHPFAFLVNKKRQKSHTNQET